jgi:hypothetical protein
MVLQQLGFSTIKMWVIVRALCYRPLQGLRASLRLGLHGHSAAANLTSCGQPIASSIFFHVHATEIRSSVVSLCNFDYELDQMVVQLDSNVPLRIAEMALR